MFWFTFSVQRVAPGLTYCTLLKPWYEDEIIPFLVGFFVTLIAVLPKGFSSINVFIFTIAFTIGVLLAIIVHILYWGTKKFKSKSP